MDDAIPVPSDGIVHMFGLAGQTVQGLQRQVRALVAEINARDLRIAELEAQLDPEPPQSKTGGG